jgi:hypothetical protein
VQLEATVFQDRGVHDALLCALTTYGWSQFYISIDRANACGLHADIAHALVHAPPTTLCTRYSARARARRYEKPVSDAPGGTTHLPQGAPDSRFLPLGMLGMDPGCAR